MGKKCSVCLEVKDEENFPLNGKYRRHQCKECWREYKNSYRAKNKDHVNEVKTLWKQKNPDKVKQHNKTFYENHKERCLDYSRTWARLNRDKRRKICLDHYHRNSDKYSLYSQEYNRNNREKLNLAARRRYQANPGKDISKVTTRKRTLKSAQPKWANTFFIEEIYHLAKIRSEVTGVKWHVDHIVPLKSDKVSGLHCEANLQVITQKDNCSKGNKYWPDMWN